MNGASDTFSYGPDGATEKELRLLGDVQGKRLLELGCGTGAVSIALAQQGAVVIGVDTDPERRVEISWDAPAKIMQATWTSPFSNRMLFESGYSAFYTDNGDPRPFGVLRRPPRRRVATGRALTCVATGPTPRRRRGPAA